MSETVIPVNSPLYQALGGQLYQINVETTAAQVKLSDGVDAETRINTLERGLAGNTTTRVVDDIAARDALSGLIPGDQVYVLDATADATVEHGGAKYILLQNGSFRKTAEDEAMDLILSWDKLENRPASPVADIDLAVAKQHSHANIETLSHLSDDGANNLLFKGKRINDGMVDVATVEVGGAIPANLRNGGLIIINPAAGNGA